MKKIIVTSIFLALLVGCSSKEPLKGERSDIVLSEFNDNVASQIDNSAVSIDNAQINKEWPGSFVNVAHNYAPLVFSMKMEPIWNASLDFEDSPTIVSAATPVVGNGILFCMDAAGVVYAFSEQNGQRLWRTSSTIAGKDGQTGGCLAYYEDKLIVSTSFAECMALNAHNGKTLWRIKLSAPAKGDALSISDDKIFVLSENSTLTAIDVNNGRTLWLHSGILADAKYLGSSGAVVDKNVVYVTYPSGEIFALSADNGRVIWDSMISKFSLMDSSKVYLHPRACPVITDDILYVSAANGKTIAIDVHNGQQIWSYDAGSFQTPIVTGNSIFIINDDGEMVCLNRLTGNKRWSISLDKEHNIHYTLLTNRGILAAFSNGVIKLISPMNGAVLRNLPSVSDKIALNPIIVNQRLFIQTVSGQIVAYK